MANYVCVMRTNYFRVKNPDKFRTFMGCVYGDADTVDLWEEKDEQGNPLFGFGSCGSISGLNEDDYDGFIAGLQRHVADDDAVIILEAGHEKMRYVIGSAEIVTSKEFKRLNITSLAVSKAAIMLNNPEWTTKCEY